MRYKDDINTEHNMKSIDRAAVAQWTKRLTRTGQTRVQFREAHIFDITYGYIYENTKDAHGEPSRRGSAFLCNPRTQMKAVLWAHSTIKLNNTNSVSYSYLHIFPMKF